jgi:hypothetical protein
MRFKIGEGAAGRNGGALPGDEVFFAGRGAGLAGFRVVLSGGEVGFVGPALVLRRCGEEVTRTGVELAGSGAVSGRWGND